MMFLQLTWGSPLAWAGYTLHERKKLHVWCVHEHDTLHRPSDYCKHHPNIFNLKV